MTELDIMEALGGIDQNLILDAKNEKRRSPLWLKCTAAAACICCLVLFMGLSLGHLIHRSEVSQQALSPGQSPVQNASDPTPTLETAPAAEEATVDNQSEEEIFFDLFREIERESMMNYVEDHPEVIRDGWMNIHINEAGLDKSGTDILTQNGDSVLAINAQQGILLVSVSIDSSNGVLAICKNTDNLRLSPSSTIGSKGQTVGAICENSGGILAITGSGFIDDGEVGTGTPAGLAVCSGTSYGSSLGETYKRLELRNDNRMYIVDSVSQVDPDTRDACEFTPALIVDGEIIVDETCGWTTLNPRAALGQNSNFDTLMIVVEGRLIDSPGCSVVSVAETLASYGCVQAMNLDGGTSAIMYYDGEYITRCSNTSLPEGREMPTAWVYG